MVRHNNIYGLILAGGKSTRMGQDKSLIAYHGKPQVEAGFDLLTPVCAKVFVSTRKDQASSAAYQKFPQLMDDPEFEGHGPLSGILSAMKNHPQVAWFVLACDLPFVNAATLNHLLKHRDSKKIATAFKSSHDGLPEPLCAIWEAGHYGAIVELFHDGIHCPRKILIQSGAHLLEPFNPTALDNINDPEEYRRAIKILGQKK